MIDERGVDDKRFEARESMCSLSGGRAAAPHHQIAVIVKNARPIEWLLRLDEQVRGIIFEPMATN